jgi:thymidylate synthase (FAD)
MLKHYGKSKVPRILEGDIMPRSVSDGLEEELDLKIKVLDKGYIIPRNYMGTDATIADSARISYQKGTRKVSADENLIRYLIRKGHTSPLEMCSIQFEVKAPLYVIQQWLRHRTGKFNQESHRYSESACEFEQAESWRLQSENNKQGSDGEIHPIQSTVLSQDEGELQTTLALTYKDRLEKGVAREQARKELPASTYSKFVWKTDLHNLFHFLALRMDSHAQKEIRDYANAIFEIVKVWVPVAAQAFEDYRLNGMSLTARDIDVLSSLVKSNENNKYENDKQVLSKMKSYGWLEPKKNDSEKLKANRERDEFETKIHKLGFTEEEDWPWYTESIRYSEETD